MSIPNLFIGVYAKILEWKEIVMQLFNRTTLRGNALHYGRHNTFCSIVIELTSMSVYLPLYSLSDDELLWIFSMKSSAILDASLPVSCVGWPLLEYGAQAAKGLQSAKISLIKKDEVTVRGCDPADIGPCSKWDPSPRGWPCLCAASSPHSRLGDGGEEQPLSKSDLGLNSNGERHSPTKLSPFAMTGLPGLWDSRESIPKLDPLVDASISTLLLLWSPCSDDHLCLTKFYVNGACRSELIAIYPEGKSKAESEMRHVSPVWKKLSSSLRSFRSLKRKWSCLWRFCTTQTLPRTIFFACLFFSKKIDTLQLKYTVGWRM